MIKESIYNDLKRLYHILSMFKWPYVNNNSNSDDDDDDNDENNVNNNNNNWMKDKTK